MSQKCKNQWTGIGYVGKDPEVRYTSAGTAVCNVSIACGRTWKNGQGEKQEKTDWIPIVAWDKMAELVGEWVHKGQLLHVEGTLQFREWEKDGVKMRAGEIVMTDIIFLRSAPGHEGRNDQSGNKSSPKPKNSPPPMDDDIPF